MISDIEPKAVYAGYFARPIKQMWAQERDKLRIGKAVRDIRSLRQRVDKLEEEAGEPRGEPDDAD